MLFRAFYTIVLLSLSSLYVQPAAEISHTGIAPDSAQSSEAAGKADPAFPEKRMYREISPGPESCTGVVICSQAEKVGVQTLVEHVQPNLTTGAGYGVNNPPVRIQGEWSRSDFFNALNGRSPKGLGSPDLHHAHQMPGSAIHEIPSGAHRGNTALHPNRFNQGVTSEMRAQDKNLHWWYRAREQGADQLFPDWIYD